MIRNILIALIILATLTLLVVYRAEIQNFRFAGTPSKELKLSMLSPFGELGAKTIAASCSFSNGRPVPGTGIGHAHEYTSCTATVDCCYGGPASAPSRSQCGGACNPAPAQAICNSVARRHPLYNQPCTSEANICGDTRTGRYDRCGVCISPPSAPRCTMTNVCGQRITGNMCDGTCTIEGGVENLNNSCIQDFEYDTENVNLNGSVEFTWKIVTKPNTTARCGFVDLTTPTPRPIPGLQELDPNIDKARITNIQTTTRFCLICQFYNVAAGGVLGTQLGEAVAHQWIKVIRIGED